MKILQKLIQIKSYSGQEKTIQQFIYSWLKKEKLPVFYQGKNVVVWFKKEKSKKSLIFNAHVDTVSAGDLSQWKFNPFKGVIKKGKIYGLGASDEKASVIALMVLAKKLAKNQASFDIWLTFVVEEETTGSGTKSFLQWFKNKDYLSKYQKIAGVICEPTNLTKIQVGHQGNIFVKITTFGDSGHGSQPEKIKKSAIDQMIKVKEKINKLEKKWQKEFYHQILGEPTISMTSIKAGNVKAPNKFPSSCQSTLDIRTVPSFHENALKFFKKELVGFSSIKIEPLYSPCPIGLTDKKDLIIKAAKQILPEAQIGLFKASCDLCFFSQYKIPAIILGPGNEEVVHQANEYCEVEKIKKAISVYQRIINLWGKGGK
ncbi:M20/M25/M40 family metallo-hydrolase [Candidatus Microgenomates bacterium]|nr:M20/M25/M40 family metallo-hydrolase [Candidatus Microgenomates bacterium]